MPNRVVVPVEDYTQVPAGLLIEGRETGKCPVCKRVGLIKKEKGKTTYFHKLSYEIADGEKPKSLYERCPI